MPEVTVLTRTTAFGYYSHNFVGLWERVADHLPPGARDRHACRASASGGCARRRSCWPPAPIERPLVFHENDRPGIMLAGAVRTYMHRYGVLPGTRVVVAHQQRFRLGRGARHRARWAARSRPSSTSAPRSRRTHLAEAARARHRRSTATPRSSGTEGRHRISRVEVRPLVARGADGKPVEIDCDLLAVSGGWAPNVALFAQSRGKLRYDERSRHSGRDSPGSTSAPPARRTALSAWPSASPRARAPGAEAARARRVSTARAVAARPCVEAARSGRGRSASSPELPSNRPKHKLRAFIDLQDDVTTKDLRLAVQEGYRSVEHAKRYTTAGMGTDQGKVANLNAFAFLAAVRGESLPAIGTTTFRQPYKPVTFAALAGQHVGDLFAPRRTTPMHDWHRAERRDLRAGRRLAARARLSASRARASTTPCSGNRRRRARRSACSTPRRSARSTCAGPDAREFLNRVYTNAWLKLAPGKARYGLMLGEDGMVMDDGVTACLADDHFHMTTTTGGAARVLGEARGLPADRVAGPARLSHHASPSNGRSPRSAGRNATGWCRELCDDLDADPHGFEFMTWRDAHDRRHPGARLPHLLHRRALLRDQHPGELRPVAVGAGDGEGREIRHHALRHRGDAPAARREGLHHRRPGDRRHGDAAAISASAAW